MGSKGTRVREVAYSFEDYRYRTPIKFGGVAVDRVTLSNVTITVETLSGQRFVGFGSMPLGNIWAFPSKVLDSSATLLAMRKLTEQIAKIYRECTTVGHPIDLTHELEPHFFPVAEGVRASMNLAEAIPKLATLVTASPFDAALHDAFGKSLNLNCYHTYGREFLPHNLDHYLGAEFQGEHLEQYISREPQARMPLYHLVGALDPITPADVKTPVGDGIPEHLGDWIRRDGLTHLKIKLNGDDLHWDVERVLAVHAIAETAKFYSLDFNERCQNVEYLLEFLRTLKSRSPAAFERVQYIEQPTARDLKANPANRMHEAAKLRPVVIDESLLDLETLLLAHEMGYTGIAFKACKGQTQSLLLAAAAQKLQMFRCVQDLTCPGASLIQSAALAAHIPGVAAIEANSRQYVPVANESWDKKFPGMFSTNDGTLHTGQLTGPGLGAV